ncbi:MAG: hypothetical protein H7Y30_10040, partial [Pyrinomonadaceae bacterium]|nr:hypothetical protein [Pyrinomonadaceae bacterium]
LYDDQYTIAGAKKKLASELRGASKLKVVTPEMSAQAPMSATPAQATYPAPASPLTEAQALVSEAQTVAAARPLTEAERDSVRDLAKQLRELLSMLDAGEAELRTHGK